LAAAAITMLSTASVTAYATPTDRDRSVSAFMFHTQTMIRHEMAMVRQEMAMLKHQEEMLSNFEKLLAHMMDPGSSRH
jgi:hypothetical protein